ncbi:MAG: glycosyltransferase [Cetobacterium sp.]
MEREKIKFVAGITFYYPTENQIKKIEKYLKVFDFIFIFDNSENNIYYLEKNEKIVYKKNIENRGLSEAFNWMSQKALNKNVDFICFLDQDSSLSNETIEGIKKEIEENKDNNTAIFCPKIIYDLKKTKDVNNIKIEDVQWCISSGSFFKVDKYKDLLFDENYFIDGIENDLCEEIKLKKYKIKQLNEYFLYQELGNKNKYGFTEHNPIRTYYIFRNRLYFYKKYRKSKVGVFFKSIKHILKILICDERKKQKMKMIYKAFRDYSKERLGRKEHD